MPPKRGQKSSTPTTTKRRRTIQPTGTDVSEAITLQLPPVEPPVQNETLNIDYDKLATAILKQSHTHNGLSVQPQEAPSVPAATSHSSDTLPKSTADPQSSSVPGPSSQQPSAQQPSAQQLSAQQPASSVSSSTPVLGTLLDQVFAGSLPDSSSSQSSTDRSSQGPLNNLNPVCLKLLESSLSSSTSKAYRRSWNLLLTWNPHISLPVSVTDVCNFIGHLFLQNYSPSTIFSHISAISFIHKLCNIPDPTQAFVTKKILKGCQAVGSRRDTRMPITGPILQKLIVALEHTVSQYSLRLLLRALFLLAFHAFLRLGEITAKSLNAVNSVLQRSDITFKQENNLLEGVQIVMRDYKTNKHHVPIIISLQACPNSLYCPVQALYKYLALYKHSSGPLFQTMDGLPITYSVVTSHLKAAIQFIGLSPDQFKGHSFRIGAATHAASLGFSENVIQKLGRWNSDAFKHYIRIQSFKI